MKLKDQVCSLELAKRLKELGVEQDAYFCWGKFEGKSWELYEDSYAGTYLDTVCEEIISAFTVAELGELLNNFKASKNAHYHKFYLECVCVKESDTSEANARAKMLIQLVEKGIVKP